MIALLLAASLASQVTIRRDTYGVPHILAETEEAASFGLGYAQAEDHAVEVARRYLEARGEQAKYLGTGAESDFRMQRFGNYEVSKRRFPELSPLFQRMLEAHAAGVNAYVEKHRERLPTWIPQFDGVDVLARCRAEILRFALRADHAPSGAGGSNMWALSGSRTTSGAPILLGNPHQPWDALFWEAHITVPGKVNFFGATYVGLPVLRHGFNEHLGWTHTVNYPNLHETYVLPLDPAQPNHYLFEGESYPLTSKQVSIQGQTRMFWGTHLGPVLSRDEKSVVAMKSAILDAYRYFEQWYEMNKAKDWKEFYSIVKWNTLPMFNLAYADDAGNIFYLWNGTVIKRPADGSVWREFHKTAELPQLFNPRGGYVQSCNDPPWYTSLRDRLDPSKFPAYFEPGRPLRLRSQMSLEMLEGQEKFSLEDVQRLKFNTKMLLADRVKADLLTAAQEGRAAEILKAWNNRVDRDSRGAVLFQRFWDTYSKAIPEPFAVPWRADDPARTPRGLADPGLAARHLADAAVWTRKTYGAEDVAWGDVHRVRIGDADLPADGAPGEYGLFHVVSFAPAADGKSVANSGDGWVLTVQFSKPLVAWSVLAYGETPGHSAQARLFAQQRFKRVPFTEAEIRANLLTSYHPGEERGNWSAKP